MLPFTKRAFSANRVSVLHQKMQHVVAKRQKEFAEFKKEYSNDSLGNVNIGQVIGGMRGLPGMLYETSNLDANEGISYRGHKLVEVRKKAPKAIPGGEPIPEGVLWLLMTGDYPSDSEIKEFKEEMDKRGSLTKSQEDSIKSFPKHMHAMT